MKRPACPVALGDRVEAWDHYRGRVVAGVVAWTHFDGWLGDYYVGITIDGETSVHDGGPLTETYFHPADIRHVEGKVPDLLDMLAEVTR